ncbi:hypothetical protein THAOC_04207, partial [Thalassiosira oceanica]
MPSLDNGPDTPAGSLPCPFREPINEYDEVLLVAENLPDGYSRQWHSLKGMEALLYNGGFRSLPVGFLAKAVASLNRGNKRGYKTDRLRLAGGQSTYYLFETDARRLESRWNTPLYNCPRSQFALHRGGISIEDGYFQAYRYKFLSKYLGSSSSTSTTGDGAARGTGEQGNASTSGAPTTLTAGNETARGTAAGERGNEATTLTADESSNELAMETGDEAAQGAGEQRNASTAGATSTPTAGDETARITAAGERGNEALTSTTDESTPPSSGEGRGMSEQGND